MADEKPANAPSSKIDLASTELKIGGVNLKGAYIIWFFAAVSTMGGAVWAGGEIWSDYKKLQSQVKAIEMPDMTPVSLLTEKVTRLEKQSAETMTIIEARATGLAGRIEAAENSLNKVSNDLRSLQTLVESNDVSKLQGAIATLRTTVDQLQVSSRDTQSGVQTLAKEAQNSMQVATREVQTVREKVIGIERDMASWKKDLDATWNAIDQLGAGSLKGR